MILLIPKVIHYCWFGKGPMPQSVKRCIASWKTYCPDYRIICWNEENFDYSEFLYTRQAYEEKKWAFVSDVARLKVVFENGGIYLDTDVELIQSLDSLLKFKSFWAFENNKHIATGLGFGAEKGNKYVKAILDDYRDKSFLDDNGKIISLPCTDLNTKVFKEAGVNINNKTQIIDNNIFLSTEYMCPIDYETGKVNITDKCISIHHYDSSWHTKKDNFLYKIGKITRKYLGKKASDKIVHFWGLFFQEGITGIIKKIKEKIH